MENSCQLIAAEIRTSLQTYVKRLAAFPAVNRTNLRLSLSSQQLPLFCAIYGESLSSVAVLVPQSPPQARQVTDHLQQVSDFLNVNSHWHLLEGPLSPQEEAGDVVSSLSQTIHYFLGRIPGHHVVVPMALLATPFPSRTQYAAQHVSLHRHETLPLSATVRALVARGYGRHETAREAGSFSVRGEHLEVRLPHSGERYRVVWHRTTIEQIIHHSQTDDRHAPRSQAVATLTIPPARFPTATVPLADLVTEHALIKPLAESDTTAPGIICDALQTDYPFPLSPLASYKSKRPLYALYQNYDRLAEYCHDHDVEPARWCQTPAASVPLALHSEAFSLISEASIFGSCTVARPISYQRGLALAGDLTPNQPAVHSDHGIGIYTGLQTRTIDAAPREYLMLQYAAGDTLSVPVEYAHKVTPYLGEKTPPINRLGGSAWQKTRRRAERDAEAFARDLLATAGQRQAREAERYCLYPDIEEHLQRSFPHELTPDQETALESIYDDLQQARPLDRLIVGDVGFGKTEVALRAARHVIANGKQVALVAPTTLLVQQHYDTARQRFPELAGQIGLLSRFVSPAEQRRVRQVITEGRLKLIIGTHALLSHSTQWHRLGLVIVDEEQRFGVKHKEHFKKIRATVDFLSLSATPIPRTLSMALSGLKELSVITTPPPGRQAVITCVTRYRDDIFRKALMFELDRRGQIYIVAPKVRSLGAIAHQVATLVPKATFALAHGQLPNRLLANIMHQFDTRAISILISSSIIESGLDLPNANTIIVMHAPAFGLSDLYQLRGRVGRRSTQGYAYFFYNQSDITTVQRQRLTAVTEATRLGSGWSLAQRDLEIRGAGNLLGAEQSGVVNNVGVQLYLDMVRDAVAAETGQAIRRHDVDIQLPLVALIPTHYIADDISRSQYYQHLSRAATIEDLAAAFTRMTDAYGTPPGEVANLRLLLKLQHTLSAAGISRLLSQQITPLDEDPYWRLTLTARDIPTTLRSIQPLGTWTVRNNTLSHDLDDITPQFLQQLNTVLDYY